MPSEHLVHYRDMQLNDILGRPPVTASTGPDGTLLRTKAWDATLKRQTHRMQVTGTGIFHMQAFDAAIVARSPGGLMPSLPPADLIYRIREGIAAEYVSGAGVSRVGWGVFKIWNSGLRGAPAAQLDEGFIGFLWYQVGAIGTNWRAVAANHLGTNLFDVDTGKLGAGGGPYNMRVDFDGRLNQRKILYYLDEVLVATFTPANDVLQGISATELRLGMGVNAQNGNVCAGHKDMLGENSWASLVQEGAPA